MHGHLSALSHTITGHAHGSSVRLRQLLDERETDAESGMGAARALLLLLEHLEHQRQKFRRDAFSGIAHADDAVRAFSRERDRDRASGWRKFYGVEQHVPEDLLQPVGVCVEAQGLWRVDELHGDVLLERAVCDRLQRGAHLGAETNACQIEHQLASEAARQLEQIFDHPKLEDRAPVDHVRRVDDLGVAVQLEDTGPAQNRCERGA